MTLSQLHQACQQLLNKGINPDTQVVIAVEEFDPPLDPAILYVDNEMNRVCISD